MILITGACGQLGGELAKALRVKDGKTNVITSDIRGPEGDLRDGEHVILDVLDKGAIIELVQTRNIDEIYHLAAVLSATGELNPIRAWELNMNSLVNVLEVARICQVEKVFWPSSIAVFGTSTPRKYTPQVAPMEPSTMYGISKLAGERWCEYYFNKYGVDVRSLRYPGVISYKSAPGGGTTDYAVSIFRGALENNAYTSYLTADTMLPMMYIDDAIRATLELMAAPAPCITVRSSYNLAAISVTPRSLSNEIKRYHPDFTIGYKPDARQAIADSWPEAIDDSVARRDWKWRHEFDLHAMTSEMFRGLRKGLGKNYEITFLNEKTK